MQTEKLPYSDCRKTTVSVMFCNIWSNFKPICFKYDILKELLYTETLKIIFKATLFRLPDNLKDVQCIKETVD